MRRRALPVAGAAGLALLALALAVVAVQVWRWPGEAAAQDALLGRHPAPAAAWSNQGGLAASLLGVEDDAAFRRAAALYRRGRAAGPDATVDELVAAVQAAIDLRSIEQGGAPRELRSLAANLEAILLAEDAVLDPDGQARVRRAADLFRRAVRLDPGNEAARANLELLLGLAGGLDGGAEAIGSGGFGDAAGAARGGSGY
jgi:hypothetical protein